MGTRTTRSLRGFRQFNTAFNALRKELVTQLYDAVEQVETHLQERTDALLGNVQEFVLENYVDTAETVTPRAGRKSQEEAPKRGRGRPRKPAPEPETEEGDDTENSTRRGRPRKQTVAVDGNPTSIDVEPGVLVNA